MTILILAVKCIYSKFLMKYGSALGKIIPIQKSYSRFVPNFIPGKLDFLINKNSDENRPFSNQKLDSDHWLGSNFISKNFEF